MTLKSFVLCAAIIAGATAAFPSVSSAQAILAEAYLESAQVAQDAGDTAKAARLYALALGESHGQQNALLAAKALLGAATIHIERSEFQQAEDSVRKALSLCDSLPSRPAEETALGLNCLALIAYHNSQYEIAEACYVKLLNDLEDTAENLVDRGILLNDLAIVKTALGEANASVQLAAAAAGIMKQRFGESSAHYAQCLDTLARALLADGLPDEAEDLMQEALDICADDIGDDSAQYGAMLLTLGKIQHARGDLATDLHNAERSVSIQEKTRGPNHPLTIRAKHELESMRDHELEAHQAKRPSHDEMVLFEEMYSDLDLLPEDVAALHQHWHELDSAERREHHRKFTGSSEPDKGDSSNASVGKKTRVAAANKPVKVAEPEDDETLFHKLYGQHKPSAEVLKERRELWEKLTPEQRRVAAQLYQQSLSSQSASK